MSDVSACSLETQQPLLAPNHRNQCLHMLAVSLELLCTNQRVRKYVLDLHVRFRGEGQGVRGESKMCLQLAYVCGLGVRGEG